MKKYKTLYLVDVSSFIFRAFYAVRELTSPKGVPVNAVYGVASMLLKLIEEVGPEYVGIIFDSKEPSFRKIMYPEYKANRSAPPEPLIPQFDLIERLVDEMKLPKVRVSGVEADDLIATAEKKWRSLGDDHRVVMVTGDKDLMALVKPETQVWDTMKDLHYTEHEVIEKFGVRPDQIRDYLAIVGDSSDNIPGISGVGPKGAQVLLQEYETLDRVLEAAKAGQVKGKKGEVIANSEKEALLSKELATLKDDVEIQVDEGYFRYQFVAPEGLLQFFDELNFKSLRQKFQSKSNSLTSDSASSFQMDLLLPSNRASFSGKNLNWITVSTTDDLKRLVEKIRNVGLMALDTETTGLNPLRDRLVGISIAVDEEGGYYIPVSHQNQGEGHFKNLNLETVHEILGPVLRNPQIKKVGQNLKFDLRVLNHAGFEVQGIFGDSMLLSYVLEPNLRHGLDELARRHLDYSMLSYESVTGTGKQAISFDQVSIETATRYSAEDAWATFCLHEKLSKELQGSSVSEKLPKVYSDFDLPLVPVVAAMEDTGIRVSLERLKELEKEFEKEAKEIEVEVQALSKVPELNLQSPKQLAVFLFEELKLPAKVKTKTGFSTDASVLEDLSKIHDAPKKILEHREVSKLLGTYVRPLQELADPETHRIHTTFHLTGTATGRLSSSDPNLQNIPIRSRRGVKIRECFVASPGTVFLAADYSQIELRILAHLSKDPELCLAFQEDQDVHQRTAMNIYGVHAEKVSSEMRSVAKAINFGLMYGKTPFGLAEELSISRTEAKHMIDEYFKKYSGVKEFLDQQVLNAKEKGFVETCFGRIRPLPEIRSSNPAVRANAERMAMNSPIQGSASDLIKLAMIQIFKGIREKQLNSKLLLQVHDELIFEVPESELETLKALVKDGMENVVQFSVPLKSNMEVGRNWGEL